MLVAGRYEFDPSVDLIARAGLSDVFRARDTLLYRDVALKVFYATGQNAVTVVERMRKAMRFEHRNVLRYFDVLLHDAPDGFAEARGGQLQIGVMELAHAGDLRDFVTRNPNSPQLPRLLQEVLHGIDYLHGEGVIHHDITPWNILLVENGGQVIPKIAGLGISEAFKGLEEAALPPISYKAPEEFDKGRFGIGGKISPNVDLWSFGAVVFEMLAGRPPFAAPDGDQIAEMERIVANTLPQDLGALPEPHQTVVRKCLIARASERVQHASELLADLGEPADPRGAGPRDPVWDDDTLVMPAPDPDAETQILRRKGATHPSGWKSSTTGQQERDPVRRRNLALVLGVVAATILFLFVSRDEQPPPVESMAAVAPSKEQIALADALAGRWDWPPIYKPGASFECQGDFLTVIRRHGSLIEIDQVGRDGSPQPIPPLDSEGWIELDGAKYKVEGRMLKVQVPKEVESATFYSLERCL